MRALISVSNKEGIVEFAKGLVALGFSILSTGGTYKVLQKSNVPAIPIEEITHFPEMMDGRVKTLHPHIHAGLLALRDNPSHMQALKDHQIEPIDLVVINLYPFEKTIAKKGVKLEDAIENIDIGGPSMIRSASKNYASVGVVVNPKCYPSILKELKANKKELSLKTKENLALEAFQHTARYDAIISGHLQKVFNKKHKTTFPNTMSPILHKISELRYGENPHQKAAYYRYEDHKGLPLSEQLHGKELSYNNLVDLEAAWVIVRNFDLPAVSIIKHTNPCGTAVGDSIKCAYEKAHAADPVSAFGSIVGINRSVDISCAEEISKTFVESVIAPDFEEDALALLMKKPSIRLIRQKDFFDSAGPLMFKYVEGGFLVQDVDAKVTFREDLTVVTKKKPTQKEINDLLFAFIVVKFVKSNAILIAKDGQTLGIGAGQMSRIDAVDIACQKSKAKIKGAVAASDAFFPFRDSVDKLAKQGIAAIIQPGGSKRDQESIDACNDHGIAMVFTGTRHFRH